MWPALEILSDLASVTVLCDQEADRSQTTYLENCIMWDFVWEEFDTTWVSRVERLLFGHIEIIHDYQWGCPNAFPNTRSLKMYFITFLAKWAECPGAATFNIPCGLRGRRNVFCVISWWCVGNGSLLDLLSSVWTLCHSVLSSHVVKVVGRWCHILALP